MALTKKNINFIDIYMGNGMKPAEAALEAGYSNGNTRQASKYAHKLLKMKDVKEEIEYRLQQIREKSIWNLEKVLEELTYLYEEVKDGRSKREAIDTLKEISKLLGLYHQENINLNAFQGINITIVSPDNNNLEIGGDILDTKV